MTVLLISGAIATGKTSVATELSARLEAELIKVRVALGTVLGIDVRDRQTLQRRGADLDERTGGRWLRDYLVEHAGLDHAVVLDSLRTFRQTLPVLDSYVDSRLVFLSAHEDTRRTRYAAAAATDPVKASVDFDTAMHHPTEREVQRLRPLAHLVLATDELTIGEVADEVLRQLRLV